MLRSPLALFLVAVAMRAIIVVALDLHQEPFRTEMRRTAETLATTGMYGNPYLIFTGPTAHVSPAHTLIAALAFRLFDVGIEGEIALYTVNILLAGVVYALLPAVARALGMPVGWGLLAGWFGALVPFHFLNEIRSGDAPLAALSLMAILTSARAILGRPMTLSCSIRIGVLWGFSLLVLPSLLCVMVAVAFLVLRYQPGRRAIVGLSVAAAVAAGVVSPWAIRNRIAFGEAVWFRSTFGMELRLAYNDVAFPDIDRNSTGGSFNLYNPLSSVEAARQVAQEGEVRYNRRLLRDAFEWIQNHPGRAAGLLAERTVYFWFPRTLKPFQSVFLSLLSVVAIVALPNLLRTQRPAAILFIATWLSFPIVYYIIESAIRYRYPMIWTLLLAAASLTFRVGKAFRKAES